MKNAIILHGTCDKEEYYSDQFPSLSNSHWLPWLQKQFLTRDIAAVTPEIPNAHEPKYDVWKLEFERFAITPDTILVGHSCGGGFLVRWLSENKVRVGKVVLVAPWLDPYQQKSAAFFDFEIDPTFVERTKGASLFSSSDDDADIQESVEKILASCPTITHRAFQNHGHFCFRDMGTDAFPELLEECL